MQQLFVPSILFLTIVAPLWLILHYRYKSRALKGISDDDRGELEQMLVALDTLSERVESLESILDNDHPEWRKEHSYER
ncbi:envelope stress response membrane protein PspB [Agaribacterium haliotis]|uniref:envelope stress response membrane protein PspB n=1 Tax=Agaribacterium haliotis TaxID=2013869 RepID=UPI000BB59EAB|nr:envelope stress response membrane protein PspB [Agaribacterium haliotis]